MEISKGIIFNIQHFSIHDGPGIRTTVFLKGCPLRCPWCSNPESQRMKPEKMKDAQREKFTLVGEEKTVEEIITEVLKDKEFYEESGGGLTLSGGEIFAQFEFAKAILKSAKEHHIHTAIETTAFVDHEKFIDLIQYVDFIYFYVTISPSRSARCETKKPSAMWVRVEGYTKKTPNAIQ
ncbi:pyruvate formate-lyase 3 [Streptococcus pneumoniae]|nr:pyruvate formate-lyase 3 [Streptococcus pneumoniae]